jgi:hypothetical protein
MRACHPMPSRQARVVFIAALRLWGAAVMRGSVPPSIALSTIMTRTRLARSAMGLSLDAERGNDMSASRHVCTVGPSFLRGVVGSAPISAVRITGMRAATKASMQPTIGSPRSTKARARRHAPNVALAQRSSVRAASSHPMVGGAGSVALLRGRSRRCTHAGKATGVRGESISRLRATWRCSGNRRAAARSAGRSSRRRNGHTLITVTQASMSVGYCARPAIRALDSSGTIRAFSAAPPSTLNSIRDLNRLGG